MKSWQRILLYTAIMVAFFFTVGYCAAKRMNVVPGPMPVGTYVGPTPTPTPNGWWQKDPGYAWEWQGNDDNPPNVTPPPQ